MARRNNRKLSRAHHDAMMMDESDRIKKKRTKADRRERKARHAHLESVLCSAFTGVAVGEEAKVAAPQVGVPVSTDVGPDVKMGGTARVRVRTVKRKRNKKAARRVKKYMERKAEQDSAMVM